MTKYILHGGNEEHMKGDDKKFYAEIVKDLPEPVKILLVFYAIDKDRWDEKFEIIKNNFAKSTNKKVELIIADEDIDKFIQLVKNSDVIYLRGGDFSPLLNKLNKINNLDELLKNKVVMGASAGCYVLAKYFYSRRHDKIFNGLGVLPIKSTCHYSDLLKDKLEELKKYKEDLEVVILPENKYVVINK